MKKILLGFIAIGLLTFVGCEKEDDTDSVDGTTDYSSIKYGEGATDIDGNTYQSVTIGTQEWMSENLKTSKYSDGTSIPNITDDTEWSNDTIGACSHYDNDSSQYESTYGKLYNWYAVETGKLCPTGWHVPTDAEWTVLTDYLGTNGHSGAEGTALKATSGWSSNRNGTDAYGWNGLPGGGCSPNGSFHDIGNDGYWWSSSENETSSAWCNDFFGSEQSVIKNENSKKYGNSVRCLRD